MSGKKAKEKRKNDKEKEKEIVVDINIKINANGQMTVTGFPQNPYQGMDMMVTATQMVVRKYHEMAMAKMPAGKVVPVKNPLVGPDGRPLQ